VPDDQGMTKRAGKIIEEFKDLVFPAGYEPVWIYPTQREVLAIMPLQQIDKKFKLPILSLTICTSCIK
jgi:DNA-binding sugar fermentation-stimulating protein